MPGTTTNAGSARNFDMGAEGGANVPQTPGGKVPSLDMGRVNQAQPSSTTNKGSANRLLLQSPSAANARNALQRATTMVGGADADKKGDLVNKLKK